MSTWFLTYPRGLAFDFADPRPEAIDIEDIAWSLSQTLRFNGHTRFAYSVAAHSIGVSYLVPAEDAFEGLMHDAAEAYVGDVVRPLKKLLGRVFGDLEDRVEQIIAAKFGLRWPWPPSVKVADMRMLAASARLAGRVPSEIHGRPLRTAGDAAASQGEALDMLLGRDATIADWLDIERRRAISAPKEEAPTKDGGP